ncbi:MAG: DUF1007 family protein [Elusimicrobiota bacterium]
MKKNNFQKNIIQITILFILFFLSTISVYGHPHILIKNKMDILINEKGVKGLNMEWEFDRMFSSSIINDYDMDEDGDFDTKETAKIKEEMFSNLKNHNYFLHIRTPQKEFEITEVKDFTATISTSAIVYNFFVPCPIEITEKSKEIALSVYDETFYVDVEYSDSPVNFIPEENSNFNITYSKEKNKDKSFYYGQFSPEEIIIKFKKL